MFNANANNVNINLNFNYKYTNNVAGVLNTFKVNAGISKKFDKKRFKRANTGINKMYHFKGNEGK